MRRRAALGAAVGAVATGAGVLWALRLTDVDPARYAELWSLRFEMPGGGELAIASLRGHPMVLNFWATWCPPCLRELPQLDRFHRTHAERGWRVVGLAVDGADAVRQFLARHPVTFPVGLAGFAGVELSRTLGNPSGALPFTALFDARGRLRFRKLGETNFEELAGWARSV